MNNNRFAFSKINYILLGAGVVTIIIGFLLMAGDSTTEKAFEPDIFSFRRTVLAPIVCLFGFISIVVAILWSPKRTNDDDKVKSEK